LNLLDAIFCAAAAVFFALICIEYGVADWWLAGLALAFVPVLYVNSVSSKDFPWALAFLLGSWWCAMRKRPVWTGILLGLAMGCRITSGAAALPIALILIDGAENRVAIRRVLATGVVSAAIVIAAFTPVYERYGIGFFSFYAEHGFPGPVEIAARMTLEVWDVLGLMGIGIALVASVVRFGKRPVVASRDVLAWIAMLVIYAIAFLCLPDEAAYLIPTIPFTLLLLWRIAPRPAFQVCCGLILLSPFVMWYKGGPQAGMIFQDDQARRFTDYQIEGFLEFTPQVSGSNAYIVGSWEPPISVLTADAPQANAKFLYLVSKPELDQLISQGWHVWYLGEVMREFDARVYGFDVAEHGARDVGMLKADEGTK
jgi:hypothetical protein